MILNICSKKKKNYCQKWDSNPRPLGGPEGSQPEKPGKGYLESGALDRSAILTVDYITTILEVVTRFIK